MFTLTHSTAQIVRFIAISALVLSASTFIIAPAMASAAVYAYVDTAGEVKSVTASDWMTAIKIAPSIGIHSGVMLLTTANDYLIVGDKVSGAK